MRSVNRRYGRVSRAWALFLTCPQPFRIDTAGTVHANWSATKADKQRKYNTITELRLREGLEAKRKTKRDMKRLGKK